MGTTFVKPALEEDGETQGNDLLHWLALHPRTADHMAKRLTDWFIGTECPVEVVTKVSAAFYSSGGQMSAVMTALFEPDTFDRLPATCRKVRQPFRLATTMCRALGPELWSEGLAQPLERFRLLEQLEAMGERPGFRPSPDGYPAENLPWESALQPRLAFVNSLAHTSELHLRLTDPQINALFAGTSISNLARRAAEIAGPDRIPLADVTAIQSQLTTWSGSSVTFARLAREAVSLIFSHPELQYLA